MKCSRKLLKWKFLMTKWIEINEKFSKFVNIKEMREKQLQTFDDDIYGFSLWILITNSSKMFNKTLNNEIQRKNSIFHQVSFILCWYWIKTRFPIDLCHSNHCCHSKNKINFTEICWISGFHYSHSQQCPLIDIFRRKSYYIRWIHSNLHIWMILTRFCCWQCLITCSNWLVT